MSGGLVSGLAEVLAEHRINFHHRAVTPNDEPLTSSNMRYTSCEGCDWLGGHRDEAGWEEHVAEIQAALVVREEAAVRPTTLREVITEAMDDAERVGMDRRTTEEWVSIRILGSSRIPLRPTAIAPQDPA